MSALVRLLYPTPPATRSPGAVFAWWERRRLSFNLAVGASGLVTVGLFSLFAALPPNGSWLMVPAMAIVAYGVMANICYSAGSVVEMLFTAWWGDDAPSLGPVLFRQGLIFSVGLTLLPNVLAVIGWGFRILRGLGVFS